jgi:hypothetical protein
VLTIFVGNLAIAAVPAAPLFAASVDTGAGAHRLLWAIACGLVLAGVWLPMNVGLMAYVFERCVAPRSDP